MAGRSSHSPLIPVLQHSPHPCSSSSSVSSTRRLVVNLDEARSPLLFYGVRSSSSSNPMRNSGEDGTQNSLTMRTTAMMKESEDSVMRMKRGVAVVHSRRRPIETNPIAGHVPTADIDNPISDIAAIYPSPTTTSIQYLEDPSQIDRMFRFDTETLGLFGTARQRHNRRQQQPQEMRCGNARLKKEGEENGDLHQTSLTVNGDNNKTQRNSHYRAVLHNALDLRCMEYKVVKIIEKNKLPASSGGDKLWRRLCHKLLRVTNSHNGLMHITDVIETDTTFYLVSERLEGTELFEFLLLERAVPEELCKYLIKQILHALDFLHSNSLLHRDVKPENLMFRRSRRPLVVPDPSGCPNPSTPGSMASTAESLALMIEDYRKRVTTNTLSTNSQRDPIDSNSNDSVSVKSRQMTSLECSRSMSLEDLRIQFELSLIDFDTCKMIDIPETEYHEVLNGRRRLVGTYGYLAPEVLRGHEYTIQSDLWSVGVILYILMTGVPPVPMDLMLNARSALEVLQGVKRKGIDFRLAPLPEFPKAQDLCISLLEFDPPRRITSARIALNHPWLSPHASNTIPYMPFHSTLTTCVPGTVPSHPPMMNVESATHLSLSRLTRDPQHQSRLPAFDDPQQQPQSRLLDDDEEHPHPSLHIELLQRDNHTEHPICSTRPHRIHPQHRHNTRLSGDTSSSDEQTKSHQDVDALMTPQLPHKDDSTTTVYYPPDMSSPTATPTARSPTTKSSPFRQLQRSRLPFALSPPQPDKTNTANRNTSRYV